MPACKKFEQDTTPRSGAVICDVGCSRCCFNCSKVSECADICPEFDERFSCDLEDYDECCVYCRFQDTEKCPLNKKPKA